MRDPAKRTCSVAGCPGHLPSDPNECAAAPERVNHPAHYGGDTTYETIKVLEAWLTPAEFIGFCKGNAIKYQSRAGKHVGGDTAMQDSQKARWYTNRMVEYMEKLPK